MIWLCPSYRIPLEQRAKGWCHPLDPFCGKNKNLQHFSCLKEKAKCCKGKSRDSTKQKSPTLVWPFVHSVVPKQIIIAWMGTVFGKPKYQRQSTRAEIKNIYFQSSSISIRTLQHCAFALNRKQGWRTLFLPQNGSKKMYPSFCPLLYSLFK